MSDPSLALQQAFYQRLTAELSCPVYDAVPADTPYPYVTLDSEAVTNDSPLNGRKRETRFLYLSVWSRYPGQAEVKRLLGEIVAALDERPLPLNVGRAVSVRVERTSTHREPDGVTYQGSVTVRVITTH